MTNTMADLRREVARRLRETLHGREIDTMEKGMPKLPHMLGIVTIGAISTPEAVTGSLLDCDHQFWETYYEDVNTDGKAKREVESAVRSLKEDDIFHVNTPYGEDAGIWYCEVGTVDDSPNLMRTQCAECGAMVTTEPDLIQQYGRYMLNFEIACDDCDFERTVGTPLHKQ